MHPTSDQQLQATAVHEAAHAVIAGLFGFTLGAVSIKPADDSAGHSISSLPSQRDHPAALEQAERRIMMLLGGTAAVRYLFPTFPDEMLGDGADLIGIHQILDSVCYFTEESCDQALRRLRAVTSAWVGSRDVQQIIREFANELLSRKTISGIHATRLFKRLLKKELSAPVARTFLNWELFDHWTR